MPIGVIANCISVLAGGVIGSALGHVLPNSLKEHLPTLFGMCSIAIGINSIIKAVSMTAVALFCCSGFDWYSTLTEGIASDPKQTETLFYFRHTTVMTSYHSFKKSFI